MPNIKSAKKRVLVNQKKQTQNRSVFSELKTQIRKFNGFIETNEIENAEKQLPVVFSALDCAVSDGLIHKNNAANKKSALAKKLSDVKSGKIVISIKKDNKTIAAEKAKAAKEARDSARAEYVKQAEEKKAAKAAAIAEKEALEKEKTAKPKKEKAEKAPKAEKAVKAEKEEKKEKPVKKAKAEEAQADKE